MTMYPQCAATPEDDGAQFEPAVIGVPYQRGQKRLREAQAFDTVAREASQFHERKARKYGFSTPKGLAHLKAARSYKEASGRLQEMFNSGGGDGGLNPSAVIHANKAAVDFHHKQAAKHGIHSDRGHAHIAAMEHHLGIMNKAKKKQSEAAFGHGNKQSPIPVPKKSEQPSEDIRQNKPMVPLEKLQKKSANRGQEAGGDIGLDLDCTEPNSIKKQLGKNRIYRGPRPNQAARRSL
jgi:hypothetical protein